MKISLIFLLTASAFATVYCGKNGRSPVSSSTKKHVTGGPLVAEKQCVRDFDARIGLICITGENKSTTTSPPPVSVTRKGGALSTFIVKNFLPLGFCQH
jgi:hypothetical protein